MDKQIFDKLKRYAQILEEHFHDMMDVEFTVENGKMYILSARIGKRSKLANLKIVMSMFCEGKMSVEDVVKKIPHQQIEDLLDEEQVIITEELELLGEGLPVSRGVGAATICFSSNEAERLIGEKEHFIFGQIEISPETMEFVCSKYCKGVITARGGMTSHAAVVCRGINKPCVTGFGDFSKMEGIIGAWDNQVTVDGNNGKVYAGLGNIKKNNCSLEEIKLLYELLIIIMKNNIISTETVPLIWRLWDVIVLHKRYRGNDNTKQIVVKKDYEYISFKPPLKDEIENIFSKLQYVNNVDLMIEDFVGFLFSEFSAQVSMGNHYLYMRPLLNPIDTIEYNEIHKEPNYSEPAGIQLTGVEFFHVNRYIDFLLDICSIKIYFCTEFFYKDEEKSNNTSYYPLNYLDFTNPNGEGLIINTYNAKGALVYINDVLIPADKLMYIYHLLRRRKYYWSWYEENNISKNEILEYLRANSFHKENSSKLYFLCEEMHLLYKDELTLSGESLIGGENMESNRDIDYILNEVFLRGYDDKSSESNDFLLLIQKKEFKDLISLELYEYYFWNERHEFDLQLLKEIVNSVCDYFNNPAVIQQIESGLLQTLPSAIIISMVTQIWSKIKKQKKVILDEDSSWMRIEKNARKIDQEFSNHDYILSDEIERIFEVSREEIQPLLKLCGCKCFINKKRSIWIKAGTKDERIKEILKKNKFKYK